MFGFLGFFASLFLIKSLLHLFEKTFMSSEQLLSFDCCNDVDGNVWSYLFESSMNVNGLFNWPNNMPESLNWVKLGPFWRFCIVNFKCYHLSYSICSSTNDKHQRSQKDCWMLVSRSWWSCSWFIWCFDPIPSTVSMSSQPPSILKSRGITCSSSKDNHHTVSWSIVAKGCWMIDSDTRVFRSAIKFCPRKRCFFNAETPNVIYRLTSSISSKD